MLDVRCQSTRFLGECRQSYATLQRAQWMSRGRCSNTDVCAWQGIFWVRLGALGGRPLTARLKASVSYTTAMWWHNGWMQRNRPRH